MVGGIAFATLTRSDGVPVFIVPDMVTEVTTPYAGLCTGAARAFVRTLSSTFCVRESPEEAVRILRAQPTTREIK